MKGDFARVTFDPTNHRTRVLQQQGRVLLEADWNEQVGIQLYLLHTLIRDLVGPCWAVGNGFTVTNTGSVPAWQVTAGHFYVDGILCENDADCALGKQPFTPTPDDASGIWNNLPPNFAVWLDAWERHLSAVEAPAILDPALQGVDTASRAQTVWQARLLSLDAKALDGITAALNVRLAAANAAGDTQTASSINNQLAQVKSLIGMLAAGAGQGASPCSTIKRILDARAAYAWPLMQARLGQPPTDSDPCVIAADARYRGCENQLYRVEIHQGGLAGTANNQNGATFKWSRENGSVIFQVTQAVPTTQTDGSTQVAITVASLGRDNQRLGLAVNDWVELVDDDYTLQQLAYPLLQVSDINVPNRMVTLVAPKGMTIYAISSAPEKHPLLRRWDQPADANTPGCVALTEGTALQLEDGIEVTFSPGGLYATGDYWLIPARVADGGVLDWPQTNGQPDVLKSRGMHHCAVLGFSLGEAAFAPCGCRFDSICALLQQSANRTTVDAAPPAIAPANPPANPVANPLAAAPPAAAAPANAVIKRPGIRRTPPSG